VTLRPKKYVVKNYDQLRPAGKRMLFMDEGHCTPAPWSINYDELRTVKFGRAAANLENPNDAAYWQELHDNPVNEDLRKLVYAVWGSTGPGFKK